MRIIYRFSFYLIPLPFFVVCFVMIALGSILGKVDPENMDRQTIVRVMQLRDFRQFSPDLVNRLTLRAEQEFGRHSPNKPVFELTFVEKRVHVFFQARRTSQQSHLERNLTLMAKTRFLEWMYEYQSAAPPRKAELMKDVVDDMMYWQEVFLDYIRFLGLPEPTLAELYEDFQRMIDAFKVGATPEEVALIDSFAKEMSRSLFATGVKELIPDRVQRVIFNLLAPKETPVKESPVD